MVSFLNYSIFIFMSLIEFLMFPILEDKDLLVFSQHCHVLKKNFASLHFIFVQGTISDEIADMIIAVAVCWVLIMNLAID